MKLVYTYGILHLKAANHSPQNKSQQIKKYQNHNMCLL